MSDSAQSDRQHGALSAETPGVDTAEEVDLVDSTSASLLLQSCDVITSEEAGDKVREPLLMDVDATTQDISWSTEKLEVKDSASVDDKSSQEEYLQSHSELHREDAAESYDDEAQLIDIPVADTSDLQSASKQEADASGSRDRESDISTKQSSAGRAALDSDVTYPEFVDTVHTDVDTDSRSAAVDEQQSRQTDSSYTEENIRKTIAEEEEKVHYVAEEEETSTDVKQKFEEHAVGITEAHVERDLHDDEQRKCAEVVPHISISVCSSVNAEDEDLLNVEDTSVPEKLIDYHSEEDATDDRMVTTTESLVLREPSDEETERDNVVTDTESKKEQEIQATEPATPEVERNLSQYHQQRERETQETSVTVEHEKHERKELTESLTEAQQLHEAKLLCSSTESMVSSTTSDWTVIDTREEHESVDSFSAIVSAEEDVTYSQQRHVDEASVLTSSYVAHAELSYHDVFEMKDEAFIGGLDESVEDEDEDIDAVEDYLTATVTPTVDLMVMSTALESILEEEERTSSSQKTTSSSEKLEHDVSDSSKLVGSSPDVQHAADSPTFHSAGKFVGGKSSDRDDVSVSSSLAEFERLERELQDKGSSDSFSGDKGSSGSASAAAVVLPESPQRKSNTSLSSSLAEFERIEHEILGQSGSLELITIDRKSHHTDSSSFSELERIEEIDKVDVAADDEQLRSSSASLAEFEYIEQQLRQNEELESEALKVATMLEKSRTSSAEKSPEAGSSQSDVHLSKEQIPESAESVSAEEIAQPAAASAEAQYPHYQDIVHIIREASKSVQTFQFSDHTSTATETVSQVDDSFTVRQDEMTSKSFITETSSTKTTFYEDVSATAATDSVSTTDDVVVVEHSEEIRSVVELRSESATLEQDFSHELEPEKLRLTTTQSRTEDHRITDLKTVEETGALVTGEEVSETVSESMEPVIQQRDDADLMILSTDSLIGIQSEDVMQLSTDSLQPGTVMTTSTDSLDIPDDSADVHRSSTSTLSSATTLLAAEGEDDEARCLMEGSVDSLESDSREPSGEWVTVYEADTVREHYEEKDAEEDAIAESTDSLEAEFGAGSEQHLVGEDAGVVSGSASYESFEADSLQDDVDEEPTLVSSQSQDSLLVAGATTTPMDISFGSSGAWSQSTVSSCTTLASSSDGEALTCSADVSTPSGGGGAPADRRLSEPSSSSPATAWSFPLGGGQLSVDNTATMLDSEGNILIAAVSADEARTPRLDDVGVCLDNRQSSVSDKQSVDRQPVEVVEASAEVDVLPGILY